MGYLCHIIMKDDLSHSSDYLSHHGVLGMKWGVRRYQNYDGVCRVTDSMLNPNYDANVRQRNDRRRVDTW